MRKYLQLVIVMILLLSATLPLSAATLLEKDMAAFDKVYIPALTLTSQGNKAAAKKAMVLMKNEWGVFKNKHSNDFSKSKTDRADLIIIDQMIADSTRTVMANGKLEDAHEILERVSDIFLKFRKRNSIDYYIDYTTKFQKPMEAIVNTAKGKTAETLTDAMLQKMRGNFKVAKQYWANLQNASLDPVLFSFDAQKESQRQDYINAETEAMNNLDKALNGGDKGETIKAALGIKANFVKLFLLFGDFPKAR